MLTLHQRLRPANSVFSVFRRKRPQVLALRLFIVLLFMWAAYACAAEPTVHPDTFQGARELGRASSRLLKESVAGISGDTEKPVANLIRYQDTIASLLKQSCLGCHGPEQTEGNFRIDQLDSDLLFGGDTQQWREVYNVVSNSVMPPADEPDFALSDTERDAIVEWLSNEMAKASIVQRGSAGHSSFRRLTNYEYNNALQDLLGISLPFEDRLPSETASEDGFKNSSELLQMSAMQFERYRTLGLAALRRAAVGRARPETVTYKIPMQEHFTKATAAANAKVFEKSDEDYEKHRMGQVLLDRQTGQAVHYTEGSASPQAEVKQGLPSQVSPVVLVMPPSREVKWNLDRFLPDEGTMRVSIRAGRSNTDEDRLASLRLIFSAHTSNNANFSQVVSQHDVPVVVSSDEPQWIHFDISLQDIQRNPFRKLATTFPRRDEFLSIRSVVSGRTGGEPLLITIDHIEVTAPFYENWPPKSHTDLFPESTDAVDEEVYGHQVLATFLRRAWRRPVLTNELDLYMSLLAKFRPDFETFEEAMLEVMATALASPDFLYITQRSPTDADKRPSSERQSISDIELASRLSFFLWASIPDETLIALAEQGKLKQPEVLRGQVDRMLADGRSRRLAENFVQQWLGLDGLNSVTHITNAELKDAMAEEPIAFFQEMLRANRSVLDFIHCDDVVINEPLAKHYRIPNVFGPHFRKVTGVSDVNRGGVLTTASVLAMNSDGKDSHPLKRGIWMLERILQDPPPPPPPNVPEVDLTDPKILKMTLKQRIVDHRNKPACYSCHSKIDPWGIAFENYDAFGIYRTKIDNQPVDATSLLYNKQELAGMDGLKRYLLANRQDQFVRAMVDKMTAYALGRSTTFADRADIDAMARQFRMQNDQLGDLVYLIIGSSIFHSR